MSSFPAMISSEPPPIDSDEAEEEFDDEFRANGLRLDISADPSPLSSPRKPPLGSSYDHQKPSPLTISKHQTEITPSLVNGNSISPEEEKLESNKVPSTFNLPNDKYLNRINGREREPEPETIHSQTPSIITSTDGWEYSNLDEGNDDLGQQCQATTFPPCDPPFQDANSLEVLQVNPAEEERESGWSLEAAQLDVSFQVNGVQDSSVPKTEDHEPLQRTLQDFTTGSIIETLGGSPKASNELQPADAAADYQPHRNIFYVSPEADALGSDEDGFGDFDAAPVFKPDDNIHKSKSVQEEEVPDLFSAASVHSSNYSDYQGSSSNPNAIGIDSLEEDFGDFSSNFNSKPTGRLVMPSASEATFTSSSKPVEHHEHSSSSHPHPSADMEPEEEEDDDFGDFASSKANDVIAPTPTPLPVATPLVLPSPNFTAPSPLRRDSLQLEGRLDALVKSVFTHPFPLSLPNERSIGSTLEPIDKQLENSASNATWTHIQEFEDSHCLLHKWPRSGVHNLLLKSLNIDASNIIYSAKYGTIQVPKFASSLVDTPLQPQSISSTPFDFPLGSTGLLEDGIPIGRLDEDDSPEERETGEQKFCPDSTLNKEAVRILEQLPDLSYMLAKTLVFPRHPNY